jgi:hypothetical protein
MKLERKYWELFKNISQGHHENRLAHADLNALKQALPHFTSLRRLIVTKHTVRKIWRWGAYFQIVAARRTR